MVKTQIVINKNKVKPLRISEFSN